GRRGRMGFIMAPRVVVPMSAARAFNSGESDRSNSFRSILKPCWRSSRRVASNSRCARVGATVASNKQTTARPNSTKMIFQRPLIGHSGNTIILLCGQKPANEIGCRLPRLFFELQCAGHKTGGPGQTEPQQRASYENRNSWDGNGRRGAGDEVRSTWAPGENGVAHRVQRNGCGVGKERGTKCFAGNVR